MIFDGAVDFCFDSSENARAWALDTSHSPSSFVYDLFNISIYYFIRTLIQSERFTKKSYTICCVVDVQCRKLSRNT